MNKKYLLPAAIIILIVIGSIASVLMKKNVQAPAPANTTPSDIELKKDLIQVSSLGAGAKILSPLAITGIARGYWYFEASFPVKVLDANGNVLGQGIAQANGDWMTTDFVPFTATISFSTPTTPTGTLVLMKDNPSGLPQNDNSLSIPVVF